MPLTFDMSSAELETYQGINPRPDDFDSFWEDALAEMREVDPQVEISPASFQTPVVVQIHAPRRMQSAGKWTHNERGEIVCL